MPTKTPVPETDPLMIAWQAYKATEEYANTRRWATHETHVDGSLWAAFVAGWSVAKKGGIDIDISNADKVTVAQDIIAHLREQLTAAKAKITRQCELVETGILIEEIRQHSAAKIEINRLKKSLMK